MAVMLLFLYSMVLRLFRKYLLIQSCFLKFFLTTIVFIWKSFMPVSLLEWILKDFEPEILYISAGFEQKLLNKLYVSDCWKLLSMVLVFQNIGQKPVVLSYKPISLFVVVSNIYEWWITFKYIVCFFISNLLFVYLKVLLTSNKHLSFVVIPQFYQ